MSGTLQSVVRKKTRPNIMPYVVPWIIFIFFSLKMDYEAHPLGATDTSYQRQLTVLHSITCAEPPIIFGTTQPILTKQFSVSTLKSVLGLHYLGIEYL